MYGVAPIDSGCIRTSAQELGDMLQNVLSSQMAEVSSLLSLQGEMASALQAVNAVADILGLTGTNFDLIV